jgi:hypothetical protein
VAFLERTVQLPPEVRFASAVDAGSVVNSYGVVKWTSSMGILGQ